MSSEFSLHGGIASGSEQRVETQTHTQPASPAGPTQTQTQHDPHTQEPVPTLTDTQRPDAVVSQAPAAAGKEEDTGEVPSPKKKRRKLPKWFETGTLREPKRKPPVTGEVADDGGPGDSAQAAGESESVAPAAASPTVPAGTRGGRGRGARGRRATGASKARGARGGRRGRGAGAAEVMSVDEILGLICADAGGPTAASSGASAAHAPAAAVSPAAVRGARSGRRGGARSRGGRGGRSTATSPAIMTSRLGNTGPGTSKTRRSPLPVIIHRSPPPAGTLSPHRPSSPHLTRQPDPSRSPRSATVAPGASVSTPGASTAAAAAPADSSSDAHPLQPQYLEESDDSGQGTGISSSDSEDTVEFKKAEAQERRIRRRKARQNLQLGEQSDSLLFARQCCLAYLRYAKHRHGEREREISSRDRYRFQRWSQAGDSGPC